MSDKHLGRGDTAVITGAASGFGLELARLCAQRGMNIVAGRRAGRRAGARRAGAGGAAARRCCRIELDVSRAAEVEAMAAATVAALRRAAPGVQQRRRRRRRPDLGTHAGRLGVGARRQRDGRGARRARVHAVDARGRRARPRLRRARDQHRVDGRAGEPAEHGRLQRQQARGGVAERDAVPGPVAGRATRCTRTCCVRSSCATGIGQSEPQSTARN